MKIAFIVTEFPSLSQTFVLNQITGLMDRGHEVDIFAETYRSDVEIPKSLEHYQLLKRTSFQRNLPLGKIRRYQKGVSEIFKLLVVNPIPMLRSLNFFKFGKEALSLRLFYQILPFLKKGPYDIVHCHFGPCGQFGIFLKELGAITGKVTTVFHGYDISKYLKTFGDSVYDNLFEKGDLFLPISECWKEKLVRLGCQKEKIVVHRMGIDTRKFLAVQRKSKEGRVQLVTIARLVEKKGVQYGIQAVARVIQSFPDIEYTIIGDGPLRGALESLIQELDIEGYVHLLGWREQEDVIKIMQHADILLVPSVTGRNGNQEGIPVVLMEALAQGKPVVSTYHSGIPELVKDNRSGFLVPEHDVSGLAEKLEYLLAHPEIWWKMGQEGRSHVERNYDINKLNDRLVALFQELHASG